MEKRYLGKRRPASVKVIRPTFVRGDVVTVRAHSTDGRRARISKVYEKVVFATVPVTDLKGKVGRPSKPRRTRTKG